MEIAGTVTLHSLDIGVIMKVCNTLVSLVQDIYGPCNKNVLLSTNTGEVKILRNGLAIFSNLHLSHPLARLIVRSIESHNLIYLDGSKTFIIYLYSLIKSIKHHLDKSQLNAHSTLRRIELLKHFSHFVQTTFDDISEIAIKKVKGCYRKNYSDMIVCLLKTSLLTNCPESEANFFTNLLSHFLAIGGRNGKYLEPILREITGKFNLYHTKITGRATQMSEVCNGILIEAYLGCLSIDGDKCSRNFALMSDSFEKGDNHSYSDVNVLLQISHKNFKDFISCKRNYFMKILTLLETGNVNVVFFVEYIPVFISEMFSNKGIYTFCLPVDRITLLRDLTGVCTLSNLVSQNINECVFSAAIDRFVDIENKVYSLIQLKATHSILYPFLGKHLLVYAPTKLLCDQICMSLIQAVKILKISLCFSKQTNNISLSSAFGDGLSEIHRNINDGCGASVLINSQNGENGDRNINESYADISLPETEGSCDTAIKLPENDNLLIIGAGGTYEAMLFNILSDSISTHEPINDIVQKCIQEMLMCVLKTLHHNLVSAKHHRFLTVWEAIMKMQRAGILCGLDYFGKISRMDTNFTMEPIVCKLALTRHVILLVVQLLRIDAIVPVRQFPNCIINRKKCDDNFQDSDDDESI